MSRDADLALIYLSKDILFRIKLTEKRVNIILISIQQYMTYFAYFPQCRNKTQSTYGYLARQHEIEICRVWEWPIAAVTKRLLVGMPITC